MSQERTALLAALRWYEDAGVDIAVDAQPNDRFERKVPDLPEFAQPTKTDEASAFIAPTTQTQSIVGHAEMIEQARHAAIAATNLNELRHAIQNFDGLTIKKTATQIVFADGNPKARIMVIGEAPGADEDRQGKPFVGVSGQLLDKIFACIGLSRQSEDMDKALYISNVLNWRPPGNRTPTEEEMQIALPFIERHIAMINPSCLVLCGGVAAKTLLNTDQAISRIRGQFTDYTFITPHITDGLNVAPHIKTLATYHPSFLLRTPIQKKKVWEDMLLLDSHLSSAQ